MYYCYKEIQLPHLYSTCVVDVAFLHIKIVHTLHHLKKKHSVLFVLYTALHENCKFISLIINSLLGMLSTIRLVSVFIHLAKNKFLNILINMSDH